MWSQMIVLAGRIFNALPHLPSAILVSAYFRKQTTLPKANIIGVGTDLPEDTTKPSEECKEEDRFVTYIVTAVQNHENDWRDDQEDTHKSVEIVEL